MKIIKAEHMGMCFGVRDAIALAETSAEREPITVVGELVHNEVVLERLRHRGVTFETDPAKIMTTRAMITAHGASERRIAGVRAQGLHVFEGTCPLVHHAHRAVAELVEEGFHPVIIGKKDHVEVRGLTEDLAEYTIVESEEDIPLIPRQTHLGIASQTTQPIDRVHRLVHMIRAAFPESEIRFKDTVCQPTKQRQRAAQEIAAQADVVIVVGGANSNNTRELVRTCAKFGAQVYHVQNAAGLRAEWFSHARVVGLTAGTSTPDDVIAEVESALRRFE